MRILLIEDDPMIGSSLAKALRDLGMSVDWITDGLDGEEALAAGEHTLVLLNLGLPGKQGLQLLKAIRIAGSRVPIIIITARDELDGRVASLDLGADDYLAKPFAVRELVARMNAVLRRQSGLAQSIMEAGDMTLDLDTHELRYHGTQIVLPAREFSLMRALMERPGTILSRAQLEERLYGWGEEVESNAVEVLIHSVRKKLDREVIRNVRGAGWMVVKAGS
jgi:two-component system, OmpR family, response regulator